MAKKKRAEYTLTPEDYRLKAALEADDAFFAREYMRVDTALLRMSSIVYDSEILDTVHIVEAVHKLTRNLRSIVDQCIEQLEKSPGGRKPDAK
jgi:hypothetical protein